MAWTDSVWLKNKIASKLVDINTGLINKLTSNENNIKTAIGNTQTAIINNDNTNRESIKTAVNNSQTSIINNDNSNKNTLVTKVDNVKTVVDTTKNNVDTIKSDVSTSKTNISSLTDKVTTLTNTVNTINTSVNTVKNEVTTVKTEVTEVKRNVGGGLINKQVWFLMKNKWLIEILKDCEMIDKNFNRLHIDQFHLIYENKDGEFIYSIGRNVYDYEYNVLVISDPPSTNYNNLKCIHFIGYGLDNTMVIKNTINIPDIVTSDTDTSANETVSSTKDFVLSRHKFNEGKSGKTTLVLNIEVDSRPNYPSIYSGRITIRNKSTTAVATTIYMNSHYLGGDRVSYLNSRAWYFNFTASIPTQYCNSNYSYDINSYIDNAKLSQAMGGQYEESNQIGGYYCYII